MITELQRALLKKVQANGELTIVDTGTLGLARDLITAGLMTPCSPISVRYRLTAHGSRYLAATTTKRSAAPTPTPEPAQTVAARKPANVVGLPPARGMIRGVPSKRLS